MFTIKEIDNKFHIFYNNQPLNDWDGTPLKYEKLNKAQKVIDIMNSDDKPRNPYKSKTTGVMDNRHRNWRRRK